MRGYRIGITMLICMLAGTGAMAQLGPDPLAGIKKATVLVALDSTGNSPGSTSEQRLQTLLELRLRAAGLRVLSAEEDRNDPDINPYIYLRVGTLETHNQAGTATGYAYRLDLSARVFGPVPLNRARAPIVLWSDDTMAVASRDTASADIERIVGELIDSFLNAWLKANPK